MPDMTLTDAQLAEIEARANAATPGPWMADGPNDSCEILIRATSQVAIEIRLAALSPEVRDVLAWQDVICLGIEAEPYNAAFIAAARADVPALIAALRASRERERRYETALNRIATFESQHGVSDEAQIARAALGEEAPHVA